MTCKSQTYNCLTVNICEIEWNQISHSANTKLHFNDCICNGDIDAYIPQSCTGVEIQTSDISLVYQQIQIQNFSSVSIQGL